MIDADATFRRAVEQVTAPAGDGRWEVHDGGDWLRVTRPDAAERAQGWKVHVSATILSAGDVLAAALPVLVARRACFKIARTPAHLADLNEGNGGLSQVGKFITAYPGDDAAAVELARALHLATAGLAGPRIPSDRPLARGSVVHYRYGVFDGELTQDALGRVVSTLVAPDGSRVADERTVPYRAPEGRLDPFVAAGLADAAEDWTPLVGGRYLRVTPLTASSRGLVHLGVDVADRRPCVIKSAHHHALVDEHGRDAVERLRREARLLGDRAGDRRFPAVLDLVDDGEEVALVMEDLGGTSLDRVVAERAARGDLGDGERLRRFALELVAVVSALHADRLVHRDLKSANVVVRPAGDLGLVDLESVARAGDVTPPHTKGTRGYVSPQAQAGAPPAIADDVFGLGAVLFLAATGAEPSQAPDPHDLLARPVRALNPRIDAAAATVIERCLERDAARRFATLDEVAGALRARRAAPPAAVRRPHAPAPEIARRLLGSICAEAVAVDDGVTWRSRHPTAAGMAARDLNSGAAGTVLALAELVDGLDGDDRARSVLARGAHALARPPGPGRARLGGLYVGEAGVAAALLRAGQVLRDDGLVDAAEERARAVAALPHASPDLFNGSAGRLRLHLLVWAERPRDEHLAAARQAAEHLLAAATRPGEGELQWAIPEGYGEMSGQAGLGYAHGAAGVADALLDLHAVEPDDRLLGAAREAGRWLARQAVPVLADGDGRAWPADEGAEPWPAFWCHGAAGIGRFLLRLAAADGDPAAAALAEGAGRTVAAATRWAGPTACHGLAGSIDLLLDLHGATGDEGWLAEAHELAALLAAFGAEHRGRLVFPSETPGEFTPDLMVGYAGVALAFLRLGDPGRIPPALRLPPQARLTPTPW